MCAISVFFFTKQEFACAKRENPRTRVMRGKEKKSNKARKDWGGNNTFSWPPLLSERVSLGDS